MSVVDDIRVRLPKLAARAPASKAAAIKAFCIECVGGSSHEAGRCENKDCWLWPHAFRRQRQPVPVRPAELMPAVVEPEPKPRAKKRRVGA